MYLECAEAQVLFRLLHGWASQWQNGLFPGTPGHRGHLPPADICAPAPAPNHRSQVTTAPLGPSVPRLPGSAEHMLGSHLAGTQRPNLSSREFHRHKEWKLLCSSQLQSNHFKMLPCVLSYQELPYSGKLHVLEIGFQRLLA